MLAKPIIASIAMNYNYHIQENLENIKIII